MSHVYTWNEKALLPDLSLVGGKARNLSILQKHNIPVPSWLAVTVKAFEALMKQRLRQIDVLTADLREMSAVKEIAERINDLIASSVFPADLANELLAEIYNRHPAIVRDRRHIIGHDEYAGPRQRPADPKVDPGNLFDWRRILV